MSAGNTFSELHQHTHYSSKKLCITFLVYYTWINTILLPTIMLLILLDFSHVVCIYNIHKSYLYHMSQW
jgi:hypothetical protein